MNRFRYAIIVDGSIKEWHLDFKTAVKAAIYYENNRSGDVMILRVVYFNGDVIA